MVHRVVVGMVSSAGVGPGFLDGQAHTEVHPHVLNGEHGRISSGVVVHGEVGPVGVGTGLPIVENGHVVSPRVNRDGQERGFVQFNVR